ncbi:Protein kinase APK1A, chloroplastic [Hordeum vulgare]|nr:Protein kinase APK1A, chloroplastic [Hordeum vulgare]
MRVPRAWWLSVRGVRVPPPSSTVERRGEIARMWEERYVADNLPLWTTYFQRRHIDQLAYINDAPAPRERHNFNGRHQWWGIPGRTLHALLEHIEGGNEPPLEYPTSSFSLQSGSSSLPRRMTGFSSSPLPSLLRHDDVAPHREGRA